MVFGRNVGAESRFCEVPQPARVLGHSVPPRPVRREGDFVRVPLRRPLADNVRQAAPQQRRWLVRLPRGVRAGRSVDASRRGHGGCRARRGHPCGLRQGFADAPVLLRRLRDEHHGSPSQFQGGAAGFRRCRAEDTRHPQRPLRQCRAVAEGQLYGVCVAVLRCALISRTAVRADVRSGAHGRQAGGQGACHPALQQVLSEGQGAARKGFRLARR